MSAFLFLPIIVLTYGIIHIDGNSHDYRNDPDFCHRHHLQKKPRFVVILLMHAAFIFLTFGPKIGGLSEFGSDEIQLQWYPAYEQWQRKNLNR
ncbi:hypothetical protein AMS62_22760 [Bacillus sp. FJAT-18019]|nr:hypothetical protein AMS62_22760 [Bacillus sp. FJAT-18019]